MAAQYYIYANDTAIVANGKTVEEVNDISSSELHTLQCWFSANKFVLNLSKTNSMLFTSTHHSERNKQLAIQTANISNSSVSHLDTTKYLGVHLDRFLKFDMHIEHLAKKIMSSTGFL